MNGVRARLRPQPGAVAGASSCALVGVVAALAGWLFPCSPWDMRGAPFMPPGDADFLLGSDSLGRDVAAGIAYGARVSLLIGGVSTAVAVLLGVTLGAVAGYAGGVVDDAIMRFTEFFQTVPSFMLASCWWRSSRPAWAPSSPPSPSSPGRRWRASSAPSSCRCARASSCRPPSARAVAHRDRLPRDPAQRALADHRARQPDGGERHPAGERPVVPGPRRPQPDFAGVS